MKILICCIEIVYWKLFHKFQIQNTLYLKCDIVKHSIYFLTITIPDVQQQNDTNPLMQFIRGERQI